MDRGSVLSGGPLKATLLSALIFLVVLVLTGIAANRYLEKRFTDELTVQISEEQILFSDIYHEGGSLALVNAIQSLETPLAPNRRVIGLFSPFGRPLAGNIGDPPDFTGWDSRPLTVSRAVPRVRDGTYYMNVRKLDGMTLVVGRSLEQLERTEQALIRAMAVAGLVAVVAMLITGCVVSGQSLRKLQVMEVTLDRISRRMNAHLDRLSHLMRSTKASAAAIAHDLVNLVQNALTHCPEGAAISLKVTRTPQALMLSIEDNGLGIQGSERARVFNPFCHIDSNRTTEGTGLGLSLVKAIADRHGATIALDNANPGLRVTLLFPL